MNPTSTPNNTYGAVHDALVLCTQNVDWSRFDLDGDGYVDMLWLVHAGMGGETLINSNWLWSINSRLSGGWRGGSAFVTMQHIPGSTTQFYHLDRFSALPEISNIRPPARSEIGVYCHEFGHALGLPDLYDTSTLST